jgi:hypothetical protein
LAQGSEAAGKGTYLCDGCGSEIVSPTPSGAIVPYLITGGFLGSRRLYACSDACLTRVVSDLPARRRSDTEQRNDV